MYSVDVEEIPDYLDVISNPMDYGTIIERLEGGSYVDLIASDDISREDENSTMEEILLLALCDIERVHHNCQVGSSLTEFTSSQCRLLTILFVLPLWRSFTTQKDPQSIAFQESMRTNGTHTSTCTFWTVSLRTSNAI